MTTTPVPVTTPPSPQLPRTDLTAAVISGAVALLAILGHVPTGMTTDQLLALGAGLVALAAFVRALWERRAELNRQQVVTSAQQAAELFRQRLEQVRARHGFDTAKLEAVVTLAHRAADPNDPTTLTPDRLLEVAGLVDPQATTAPIDVPPEETTT